MYIKYSYLNNPIFDNAKRDLDMAIEQALDEMIHYGAEEATVTLKLDVTLECGGIDLRHSANYTVPVKDKFDGKTKPGQFKFENTPDGLAIIPAMDQLKL